ncbi:YdcF family protein [Paenibacillus sp. CC-CFT747]|nr:YdcF family protein [Paenibacillus sp. CC-CFT747]
MYLSELDVEQAEADLIHRAVFAGLEDDGKKGDLILVFGSIRAPELRVPKAVELYKAGRAPLILMSGGTSTIPEALAMKEAAVKLGVKEEVVWTETRSTNTKENALLSRKLLDQRYGLDRIRRILLVTNAFHMRRCYLTMKTWMPEWIDYSFCRVEDRNTRPDNWHLQEKGRRRVYREAEKLALYTRTKEIVDMEI